MLAMIKKSGALRRESSEVIEMVAKIAEANGFRADDDAFAECFAHSEFADWNFTHEGLVVESAHKAPIRKTIHVASRLTKLQEVEEGEFQAPPEGKDQLQLLGEMLSKCSKKSANRETHVDTSKILRDECGNWGDTAHFLLPNSENTNAMAKDLEKLKEKVIATHFVYSNIAKLAPEWHSGSYTEGFLLPPAVLMPALLRWAMACQANKMISMHIGVTHADICMRVAEEARNRQMHSTTAAAYDEIIRKNFAEMSLKGVANFEPSTLLCTFDREIFEQACQLADNRMALRCKHGTEGSKHKGFGKGQAGHGKGYEPWKSQESWKRDSWRAQEQNKRPHEKSWKTWESNKKGKY